MRRTSALADVAATSPAVAVTALAISLLSLALSFVGYRDQRADKSREQETLRQAAQIDQMNGTSRKLEEFRSLAYLYFFATVVTYNGSKPVDLEIRHAEYHRLNADLQSTLEVVPYFFGDCVEYRAKALSAYFADKPWESQIQNGDFEEKVRNDQPPTENLTDVISRAIFVDRFVHLSLELRKAMANEIGSARKPRTTKGDPQWWEEPCEDAPVAVEIHASAETIKQGEVVTFTPLVTNGPPDFVYSFDWSIDEGFRGSARPMEARFAHRGTKIVNLTATAMTTTKEGQTTHLHVKKVLFVSKTVRVVGD